MSPCIQDRPEEIAVPLENKSYSTVEQKTRLMAICIQHRIATVPDGDRLIRVRIVIRYLKTSLNRTCGGVAYAESPAKNVGMMY
jgi:hypothetical protein